MENDVDFHKLFSQVIKLHFYLTQDELDKEGLYPGQPQLLFVLFKNPGFNQREIANSLRIKPATVNVMIKRLEKGNFLYKQTDEKDARVSRVYLTDRGISVCKNLRTLSKNITNICLNDFTTEEVTSLEYLLTKIKNNLERKDNKI